MKKYFLIVIAFLFTSGSQAQLVSYTLQQSFTVSQLDSFLQQSGFNLPVTPQYSIDVYQLIYKTPYKHIDSLVNASGIVVFPKNRACPSALSCYAHGTFSRRDEVPSYVGPERPIGLFFAGIGGVVTAMPDELGLGDSDSSILIHPYINAFHSGYASVNLMRAARQLADTLHIALSGEVALTGYSQGGYTTMATAKLIQENFSSEFNVVALAPMSGPYDLNVTMTDLMLSSAPYATPSYLPYLLLGQHSVYPSLQQRYPNPAAIFKSPYDSILPPMYYSKNYSLNQINAFCDSVPRNMIRDSVLNDFINDPGHPFRIVLAENDLLGWAPQKPVKVAYCTADEQVSYLNAIRADSAWRVNGAPDIQIQNFGNTNHAGCVEPSITSTAFFILGKLSVCTGISKEPSISFRLFPNPSNGEITLVKEEGVFEIAVFNVDGQKVYSNKLVNDVETVKLPTMPPGIYSVQLADTRGQKAQRKLVIQ